MPGRRRGHVLRHRAHAARHDDPRGELEPRDGPVARHRYQVSLSRRVRGRRRVGGAGGHDCGAGFGRVSRHGRAGAHHLLRRRRHRRDRLGARRLSRVTARRLRRYVRQGAVPRGRGHCRVSADGGDSSLEARRAVQAGLAPFMDIRAPRVLIPVLVIALLVVFPLATTGFYLEFTTKVMILAIFALSLELLVGATGLVSLGHAAFYGIAAYATVLLSPKYGAASAFWLLPAAIACSALYALAVGALSLRTKGVYFIMVTLAFAQMAYYVIHDTELGGGTDGIYLNVKPEVALFGWKLVELGKPVVLYYVVL